MINYQLLQNSIEYYNKLGFVRIETPWMVSEYVDNLTKPNHIISSQLKHNNECLVASGEQSFLELYLKNYLPKGKFQTITPCFRIEEIDFLHSKNFMKNELIITDNPTDKELNILVENCLIFFQKELPKSYVKKTDIGFDIEINNYELGSYGIRQTEFLTWIYATGCAEPRFSTLINMYK